MLLCFSWQILGADSGWQPVPLTDLITAVAVKKAYRKATLCVHPDKLQQRGATIRQKYICEKVFDLLKVCALSTLNALVIWKLDLCSPAATCFAGCLEQIHFGGALGGGARAAVYFEAGDSYIFYSDIVSFLIQN